MTARQTRGLLSKDFEKQKTKKAWFFCFFHKFYGLRRRGHCEKNPKMEEIGKTGIFLSVDRSEKMPQKDTEERRRMVNC